MTSISAAIKAHFFNICGSSWTLQSISSLRDGSVSPGPRGCKQNARGVGEAERND